MAILVGIIDTDVDYSNNYGFNSVKTSNLIIIKEGTTEELVSYVKEKRDEVTNSKLEISELRKTYNECYDKGGDLLKEYRKKCELITQKLEFEKYKNVLIVNGMIV